MNENLNLVEILKDCPKGMELDCTMFDNVTFAGVVENRVFPIRIIVGGGTTMVLTKYGQYTDDDFAKCVIFPKGETTWEGFVPPHKFKDGDILSYQNARLSHRTIYIYRYHKRLNTSYYVALSFDPKKSLMICNKGGLALNGYNDTVRFATKDEKKELFQTIKDNGYKWNAKTKTLEKLVKPKFDPKTLKPFDKVLVRDFAGTEWSCDLFSYIENVKNQEESFMCTGCSEYNFCIPYNDKTKHLVGTTEEAPEYYRYWED